MNDLNEAIYNIEAEHAVLGSMLIDADCIGKLLPMLREDDFSGANSRLTFETIRRMRSEGAMIDGVTVAEAMQADKEQRAFLRELMEVTPTSANAKEYAEIVADTGKRRRLRNSLREALDDIDERRDATEVVASVERAVQDYHEASRKAMLSPTEQFDSFYAYRHQIDEGAKNTTRTGFRQLDRLLGRGMLNAGLYFLAARPGVGKTALALNIAEYVGKTQGPVCFISLEMTNAQLMARRIAAEAKIDSKNLLTEKLTEEEYAKVAAAAVELSKSRMFVTEEPMTVQKAVSIAQACHGVRLVVIDHFTLFLRPHKQADHAEYSEIAHELAHLAKNINAPVLCLIQLNRESDQRKGRPRISDLRGSGATEEDAAGVMILHRIETEAEALSEVAQQIGVPRMQEIYLDKNRFGDIGRVTLSFYPKINTFREAFAS